MDKYVKIDISVYYRMDEAEINLEKASNIFLVQKKINEIEEINFHHNEGDKVVVNSISVEDV